MDQSSFHDRLAKIEDKAASETAERRFDAQAIEHRDARPHLSRDRGEEDEGSSAFWAFYTVLGIPLVYAYSKMPEGSEPLIWSGIAIYVGIGVLKIITTIYTRGFSAGRDGDNILDLADTASSLFKLFR